MIDRKAAQIPNSSHLKARLVNGRRQQRSESICFSNVHILENGLFNNKKATPFTKETIFTIFSVK